MPRRAPRKFPVMISTRSEGNNFSKRFVHGMSFSTKIEPKGNSTTRSDGIGGFDPSSYSASHSSFDA